MTEEMKAKDATRYMVMQLPDMISVAGPFNTEGDARKASDEAARAKPGVEFGIFQKVFVTCAQLVVETKGLVG